MKRCAELRDLSEDHHHGLVLARRCRRAAAIGDQNVVATAWADARLRFERELAPHFAAEEAALLPALRAVGASDVADRIASEHAALRASMAPGADRGAGALDAFGTLLHDHIRFEERVVFERAQDVLDLDALGAVRAARSTAPVERVTCDLPMARGEGGTDRDGPGAN
ncbi:hypothetical protein Pla163_37600 [Planctomycetes bacterium Pla163]|uniref:Hemerythrin-like domain-containing protein n=1 Tax=Rohdeia mirabilis TaxID=2528008 RepID=A0A518D572_9BACT|nr:hypothetical protein Pla163_37600 [Planctomycetes bacterium Pla163]